MSGIDGIELQRRRPDFPASSASQRLSYDAERKSVLEPLVGSEAVNDTPASVPRGGPTVSRRNSMAAAHEKNRPTGNPNVTQEPSYVEILQDDGVLKPKGKSRRSSIIRHLVLVHLPPVAVTLSVLSLYIAKVRWNQPSTEALNALQFAAKIHEALIIVSLGSILMGRINYHLLAQGKTLPLGFLSSPMLLNSPFLYLFSQELWAPMLNSAGRRTQKVTGSMIITVFILCLAASPLSAITLLPRQGWLEIPVLFTGPSYYITYSSGSLYNTDLDARAIPDHKDKWISGIGSKASQRALLETATLTKDPNNSEDDRPYVNATYTNYDSISRPVSYRTFWQAETIATCPLSRIASGLADTNRWRDPPLDVLTKAENKVSGSSKLMKWKQPLVAVDCIATELENGVANFVFRSSPADLEIQSKQYPVLRNLEKNTDIPGGPLESGSFHLKSSKKLRISTDLFFVSGINETSSGDRKFRDTVIELSICLISARWIEADNWIEFSRSSDTLSHFSFPREEALSKVRDSFDTSDFIDIQDEWMTGIASLPNTSSNRSSYEEIMDFCCGNTGCRTDCLQLSLSMHLVDAMSQLGQFSERNFGDDRSYKDVDTGNDGMAVLTSYTYTYGYEFGSSIAIPIAFSILLLHVLIILVYFFLLFYSEHLWYKSGWDSVGDLLVLTLYSNVPAEGDLTKIEASEKWTKPVVLREVGDTGRNGIVVGGIDDDFGRD